MPSTCRPRRRCSNGSLTMAATRIEIVEQNLERYLASAEPAPWSLGDDDPLREDGLLTARKATLLFEAMALSRALDIAARELKKQSRSFYTIGSSGHELNACVGDVLRLDDPCFLHYRSGALMMARS